MKIVVGLGNPGFRYLYTYHNIGKLFAQWFIESDCIVWQKLEKSDYTLYKNNSQIVIISEVFMNLSHKAIMPIVAMHKIQLKNVLVLHDELMKKQGILNLKLGGGNAGHNGLRSITEHVGNDFARMQIGIDHPKNVANYEGSVSDYVLSKMQNLDEYKNTFEMRGKNMIQNWLEDE